MLLNKCSLDKATHKSVTHRQCCTLSFLLFTLLFYLLSFAEGNATIRYVSKTGLSIPPYITWETAADSIQKCINICVFGDTIYVASGVYEEQVVMISGLSLIGAGADSCVIYLSATGIPAVQIMDSCLLMGFKILLPNTLNTWGIQADYNGYSSVVILNRIVNASLGMSVRYSNPYVYKNIFQNIKSIGIRLFNSNSIIRLNEISPVTEPNGSGVFITALSSNYTPIIDSNYIVVINECGIRKAFGTRPIIVNNNIIVTGIGIELSASDTAIVNNNLIIAVGLSAGIRNQATQYLQVINNHLIGKFLQIFFIGPDNKVKNNVVSNAEGEISAWGSLNLQYQYNNVWNSNVNYNGLTLDTTNLSVNPMVVNEDSTQGDLDLHLQKYSPLIGAGDPTILDKDSSRSDIGLYGGPYGESYLYLDLPPRPPVNLTANVEDSTITLTWNRNTEADFSYYKLYRDTVNNFIVDSTKLIAPLTDTFYNQTTPTDVETLYYKLTAIDNQGNESNPSEQVSVKLVSVKNEWVPVNNYVLYQNYPNPFNPSTRIGYKLKKRGYVKLYVYDIKGELVSVLANEVQEAGYYEVLFDASASHSGEVRNLASGVYIYQIFIKGENNIPVFSDIKKMVLVK